MIFPPNASKYTGFDYIAFMSIILLSAPPVVTNQSTELGVNFIFNFCVSYETTSLN
mgnify:CR=1 FL=1|jgi:hypothetical protein